MAKRSSPISTAQAVRIVDANGTAINTFGTATPLTSSSIKVGQAKSVGTTVTTVIQSASGKTWQIEEINFAYMATNAANAGFAIVLTDSADSAIAILYDSRSASNHGVTPGFMAQAIRVPIQLSSQQKIRCMGGAAGDWWACSAIAREVS